MLTLILDETTDVSTKNILSVMLRYVNSDNKLVERFWGFYDVSHETG